MIAVQQTLLWKDEGSMLAVQQTLLLKDEGSQACSSADSSLER